MSERNKVIKILELFAGIGACSKALTNLGIKHKIVDAVEIDKYAIKSFNAIHGTNFEPQDITKWDKDIDVDLIMHGSPCQDFSVAGKQAGGDKDSGTRSSLMYETLRIVEKLKPKYVIWENVKNLLSKKHRHNFDSYLEAMEKLGYKNYCQVLNAKDFGVPQNRERVFTVSILCDKIVYDDYNSNVRVDQDTIGTLTTNCGAQAPRNGWKIIEEKINFQFPEPIPLEKKLKDLLEKKVDEKYYLSEKAMSCFMSDGTGKYPRRERFLQNINRRNQDIGNSVTTRAGGRPTDNFVKEPFIVASRGRNPDNPSDRTTGAPTKQRLEPKFDGTTNTITTVQKDNYVAIRTANKTGYDLATDGDGIDLAYPDSKTRRGRVGHGVSKTLPTSDSQGVMDGYRIRKLTPLECWRLMGFDDADFHKAEKVNSNTQLYKQAGNSICVNVLEAILANLLIRRQYGE
jgi:DNA (cytosine-5)-methyltransferase 1